MKQFKPSVCKFSAKPGISATLMLVMMSLALVSITSSIMMIAPSESRLQINSEQRQAIIEVADHHLDVLEERIKNHPEQFMQYYTDCAEGNRIWDCNWESKQGDNLPMFQRIKNAKYTDVTVVPASLKTFTQTVTVAQTDITVNSSTFWDNVKGEYSFIRFPEAAYGGGLQITVEAKAAGVGSATVRRSRLINFAPESCNVNQAHTSTIFSYDIPLQAGEDTTNFRLTKFINGMVQVGNQRLCWLPEMNHNGTLECVLYYPDGTDLLAVDRDNNPNINAGEQSWVIFAKADFSNVANMDNLWLFYVWDTSNVAGALNLNSRNIAANDIYLDHFNPPLSDNTNGGKHKAIIFYPNRTTSALTYRTWQWDMAAIPNPSAETTLITPGNFTNVDNFAYDRNNHLLVVANVNSGGGPNDIIQVGTVTPDPGGVAANLPTISALTASNSATTITNFGRPVISNDGQFVVVPAMIAGHAEIWAYSVKDVRITGNNLISAGGSNFVPLHIFDQPLASLDINPDKGETVGSLTDIDVWFNPDTQKFYWITRDANADNAPSERVLYEWDPKSWGNGDAGGAKQWVPNAQELNKKANRKVRGDDPNALGLAVYTDYGYSGEMWNVRKIPMNATVWTNVSPLKVLYSKRTRNYVFRDNNNIYVVNVFTGGLGGAVATIAAPPGRNIAMDPQSGMAFFSSSNASDGIYSYNPFNHVVSQAVSMNFSDNSGAGDGDLAYFRNNEGLYYLQVPPVVDAGNRPSVKLYLPFCNKFGRESLAGDIQGFTSVGNAEWVDIDEYGQDWLN